MIKLRALNNKDFILNSDQIEKMEQVPETLITLINGKKYMVLESPEEVIKEIIIYKKKIYGADL
ncbi:flagellar protein FlbD [Clostridium amylolyticum]|uniref:Flagellar protein FlbD n=1 Tax=Clostridium amylolyticum TaxID=1121298 RepID=A0A1M6CFK9_9CLOT|nr:flagellar FlbD family protein [Clostridium amylolyticum]SHI59815.1 flagellar protein FlbD [Clostridium amylolyticum]